MLLRLFLPQPNQTKTDAESSAAPARSHCCRHNATQLAGTETPSRPVAKFYPVEGAEM